MAWKLCALVREPRWHRDADSGAVQPGALPTRYPGVVQRDFGSPRRRSDQLSRKCCVRAASPAATRGVDRHGCRVGEPEQHHDDAAHGRQQRHVHVVAGMLAPGSWQLMVQDASGTAVRTITGVRRGDRHDVGHDERRGHAGARRRLHNYFEQRAEQSNGTAVDDVSCRRRSVRVPRHRDNADRSDLPERLGRPGRGHKSGRAQHHDRRRTRRFGHPLVPAAGRHRHLPAIHRQPRLLGQRAGDARVPQPVRHRCRRRHRHPRHHGWLSRCRRPWRCRRPRRADGQLGDRLACRRCDPGRRLGA